MIANLTGILLCGGKSLRMGTDKALLELQSQPMIYYPLKIVQHYCSEILISANDERLDFLGYPVIRDEMRDIGPMGGIHSCLKKSTNPYSLVLACDMPLITGSLLKNIIPVDDRYDALVPVVNNRSEPLYSVYHSRVVKEIEQHIRSYSFSLQQLLSQLNVFYVETGENEIMELFNANTPNEIVTYERIVRNDLS